MHGVIHNLKSWEELPPRFCLTALLFFAASELAGSRLISGSAVDLHHEILILRSVQLIGLLALIRYFRLFDAMGWRSPDSQTLYVTVMCAASSLAAVLLLLALWPETGRVFRLQDALQGIGGMLLICVMAPLVEETVFRGVVYRMLRESFGIYAAIIASTLLFALMHGSIMLPQLAGGVIFAIAYEWSRNLWAPILLHSSGNLLIWSGVLPSF
jgi:uncharacterized protein